MKLMTKGIVVVCSFIVAASVFAAGSVAASGFPVASLGQLDPGLASGKPRLGVLAVGDSKGGVKQRMMNVSFSPKLHVLRFMLDKRSSFAGSLSQVPVSLFFSGNQGNTQVVFKGKARKLGGRGNTDTWVVAPDHIYMMAAANSSGKAMTFEMQHGAWKQRDSNINW